MPLSLRPFFSRQRLILSVLSLFAGAGFLTAQPLIQKTETRLSPAAAAILEKTSPNTVIAWHLLAENDRAWRDSLALYPGIRFQEVYPPLQVYRVLLSPAQVQKLAGWPCVRFIDRATTAHPELFSGTMEGATNHINRLQAVYPAFNGSGINLCIRENQFDSTDLDLRGRSLPNPAATPANNSHATLMATLAAGAGNTWYATRGPAWGARLVSSPYTSLFPDAPAFFQQYAVSIQNHSYGTAIENYYGPEALAYDQLVYAQPALLHVFSSGNSGTLASPNGSYSGLNGFANLTGQFKMAKNILLAGATDSFRVLSPASSRGPAFDGRLRPEIVALGEDGSSGAAALTSGTAAALQQAYRAAQSGQQPPASLVKALLINGADDAGAAGPDHLTGFGSLNAFRAMEQLQLGRYATDLVTSGQERLIPIVIPAGMKSVRITLVWTDPPAALNAAKALVNDLDLELTESASGTTWQPWVLSHFPHRDSLLLPARRGRDILNNAEQISLLNPAPGNYLIRVKAGSLSTAQQAFSLAWHFEENNRFTWQFPLRNDPVLADAVNVLRWESTLPSATGTIQYSLDEGSSWQTVSSAADLATGYFKWKAPAVFSRCLLRMVAGGNYETDTVVISRGLNLQTGFNCTDSFGIQWSPQAGASAYRIYAAGPQYLQPLAITTDTVRVGGKSGQPATVFAVAPLIGGREGVRSFAMDIDRQGLDCYIKSFFADRTGNTARIRLELGSTYQLRSMQLFRIAGGDSVAIQRIAPLSGTSYTFFDPGLRTGATGYRIVLETHSGQRFVSPLALVLYSSEEQLFVYPNPLVRGQNLNVVLNDAQNGELQVMDAAGRLLMRSRVTAGGTEEIPTLRLPAGIYLLRLQGHTAPVRTTRFIVY